MIAVKDALASLNRIQAAVPVEARVGLKDDFLVVEGFIDQGRPEGTPSHFPPPPRSPAPAPAPAPKKGP
jgi:hypothetical protein